MGYASVAHEFGLEVQPGIDMNFVGIPLSGSLVDAAMRATTEISVLINSDILLTQSMIDALARARVQFTDWFMVGARHDVPELPPMYEPTSREDYPEAAFINYVRTKGTLHTAGGVDFFAWNNRPGKRLLHGTIPPFIWARSKCPWY